MLPRSAVDRVMRNTGQNVFGLEVVFRLEAAIAGASVNASNSKLEPARSNVG